MLFAVLFALLGLFLAGFREGVWRQYSPEDTAGWRAEGTVTRMTAGQSEPPLSAPAFFSAGEASAHLPQSRASVQKAA